MLGTSDKAMQILQMLNFIECLVQLIRLRQLYKYFRFMLCLRQQLVPICAGLLQVMCLS